MACCLERITARGSDDTVITLTVCSAAEYVTEPGRGSELEMTHGARISKQGASLCAISDGLASFVCSSPSISLQLEHDRIRNHHTSGLA